MRLRLFALVLLLCASSFLLAQSGPDFSGVYLRNRTKSELRAGADALGQRIRLLQEVEQALDEGSPLILAVTQTEDSIEVTKLQNGAKATSHYDLNRSKSKKARFRASESIGRAKFKREILLVEYNAPLPMSSATSFRIKEMWQLSPDSRILKIQQLPTGDAETYTRQASLNSALSRASEASLMNKCSCLRVPADDRLNNEGVAELGFTAYRQLNTCILFNAQLLGGFFEALERSDTPNGTWFRKSGQLVSEFPDNVVLDIAPRVAECAPESFSVIPMTMSAMPLPPSFWDSAFGLDGQALRYES